MEHITAGIIRWGVFIVLATLPSYLLRFNVGPIPTTALEVMIYALAAVSLFRDRGKMIPAAFRPFVIPTALLVVAAAIGVLVATDTRAALGIFKAYFFDPLLFLWVFLWVIRTDSDRKFAMAGLAIGALFVALSVIVQWTLNLGIPPPWNLERRATGIFPYPNAVGLFLAPLAVLFLTIKTNVGAGFSLPSIEGGLKAAPTFRLIGILAIIAMILSKTESALLAVAAGLAFAFVSNPPLRLRGVGSVTTIIVTTVVLVGLLLSVPQLRTKLLLQDWSGTVRRLTWTETITMLKDRPLLGAGLSGYPTIFAPYHKHTAIEIFQYPHNIILNFWSEVGLIGLTAFMWLIIVFFRSVFARSSTTCLAGRQAKQSSIALAAAMTTLLVHGLFDVPYFKNDLAILFWVLIALAISGMVSSPQKTRSEN